MLALAGIAAFVIVIGLVVWLMVPVWLRELEQRVTDRDVFWND